MRSPFLLLLAFLIQSAFPANSRAAEVVYDNGPSSRQDGWEMTQWFEADDFVLTEKTRVTGLKFWNYVNPGAFTGLVTWEIYANGPGNKPGALVATGISSNLVHTATGYALFGVLQEFFTTFSMTPVVLDAGTYWMALHNGTRENVRRGMFWAPIRGRYGAPSHNRLPPNGSPWMTNEYPGYPTDLAFQVVGTPGPALRSLGIVNGLPTFRFKTSAGENYRLEYKKNITDEAWATVPGRESIPGNGGEMEIDDPVSNTGRVPRRFYRILLL